MSMGDFAAHLHKADNVVDEHLADDNDLYINGALIGKMPATLRTEEANLTTETGQEVWGIQTYMSVQKRFCRPQMKGAIIYNRGVDGTNTWFKVGRTQDLRTNRVKLILHKARPEELTAFNKRRSSDGNRTLPDKTSVLRSAR